MEELSHARMSNGEYSSHPSTKHSSVMRDFLESGIEFEWPSDLGECNRNHCNFKPEIKAVPLLWIRKISDKKASIDMYKAPPDYNYSFKKPFVVKTIRESSSKKARDEAANEVNTMQDLRHPHVTALLGTFMFQERLSILIFPAASCDLHRFMKKMSKDFQHIRDQGFSLEVLSRTVSRSDGTTTPDSTGSSSKFRLGPEKTVGGRLGKYPQSNKNDAWPLNLPFQEKVNTLRRYFVCLSQALSYLHESDVRHKDIKPENILIDESGSVILTDFGISRRFAKGRSHVTSNEWKFTRKYASPEIMKGKRVPRDDPSDVFSLGCVFLEMVTLLLGRNLSNFSEHYTTAVNESAVEEAYHCNLSKVHSWIDYLRKPYSTKSVQIEALLSARVEGQDFSPDPDQSIIDALIHIRKMLDENPQVRPKSRGLWEAFQHISPEKCKDCDPRHRGVWGPSERQQHDAETGLNKRRSIISEEAASLESRELHKYGDIHSKLLSVKDITNRSELRMRRISSPSSSLQTVSRRDNTKLTSRPSSETYRRRIVNQGPNARGSRSSSPTMGRTQIRPEDMSDHRTPESPHTLSMVSLQGKAFDTLHKTPSNIDPTLTHPPAIKEDKAVHVAGSPILNSNLSGQDVQVVRVSFPAARHHQHDEISKDLSQDVPPPNTQVIVYDLKRRHAYQSPFAPLQDQDYRSYPLPRLAQQVEIGEKAELIAKVELGSLGLFTRFRRALGEFPRIYVLNYAARPLG